MSTAPSQRQFEPSRIIIVMGVSSSGKSTVGKAVGRRLHAPFLDGDDYHPEANKKKMADGIPLTDDDRWPWLETFAKALHEAADRKGVAVGACSALKKSYRQFLTKNAGEPILFVYLSGTKDVIAERMNKRKHEYMPTSLLDSQFATLEEPDDTENALTLDVTEPVETLATKVAKVMDNVKTFKRWQ